MMDGTRGGGKRVRGVARLLEVIPDFVVVEEDLFEGWGGVDQVSPERRNITSVCQFEEI